MCSQIFQKIENFGSNQQIDQIKFEKCAYKVFKKLETSQNVRTNFSKNKKNLK